MIIRLYFALPDIFRDSSRNKKLLWLSLFFLNIAAVIAIWFTNSRYYIMNPDGGNIWIALGRLTGLLLECMILVELVLIGRITAIEQTFGFDKMNWWHRWIGYSLFFFLVTHPLLLSIGNAEANGVSAWSQFNDFLTNTEDVFLAFISVMILGYIVLISISAIRKKVRYELWYFVHLLVYLAITLAFFHQINTGDVSRPPTLYYWLILNFTVFGVMLLHRFLKPLWRSYRFNFRVARVDMETKDTYSVYITGENIGRFRYHAGQYANINFLQKGLWYTHPFSFSAEPNEAGIRFTMKALGDYTKRLGELKPGTRVIIDGPLGRFVETKAKREKLLLIAGGIGVTPIRALVGELVAKKKDMVLLYAARSVEDIAFRGEFEALQGMCNFPIHYILGAPTPGYESGFIDREKIVRLVPDFYDRDVFLCGPPPMMDATVKNLEGLGLDRGHIHFEKFSF